MSDRIEEIRQAAKRRELTPKETDFLLEQLEQVTEQRDFQYPGGLPALLVERDQFKAEVERLCAELEADKEVRQEFLRIVEVVNRLRAEGNGQILAIQHQAEEIERLRAELDAIGRHSARLVDSSPCGVEGHKGVDWEDLRVTSNQEYLSKCLGGNERRKRDLGGHCEACEREVKVREDGALENHGHWMEMLGFTDFPLPGTPQIAIEWFTKNLQEQNRRLRELLDKCTPPAPSYWIPRQSENEPAERDYRGFIESSICACGHSWLWHAEYDDSLDRFATHGCDHWSGCHCDGFKAHPEPKGE